MSMNSSKSALAHMTKELTMQWRQTREKWRDEKAQEFEHAYIEDLINTVHTSLEAISKLDKLITKVRKDCE